jgi:ankyrin repeat protein
MSSWLQWCLSLLSAAPPPAPEYRVLTEVEARALLAGGLAAAPARSARKRGADSPASLELAASYDPSTPAHILGSVSDDQIDETVLCAADVAKLAELRAHFPACASNHRTLREAFVAHAVLCDLPRVFALMASGPKGGIEYGHEAPTRVHARGFAAEADRVWTILLACGKWSGPSMLQDVLINGKHGDRKWTRLHWAARNNKVARVTELLAMRLCEVDARDKEGATPLHWACQGGHVEVAKLLLDRPTKRADIEAQTDKGMRPLGFACLNGHTAVAELLLSRGAAIEAKCELGRTALHDASQKGHLETAQLLISKGAAVDAANDEKGATPLHIASTFGHLAVVRELLKAGADPAKRSADDGMMPLHSACSGGHSEIVRELLSKGIDKDVTDNTGNTPLIWACDRGHLAATTLLIVEHGADINHLDNGGRSGLFWAKRRVVQDAAAPRAGKQPPSAAERAEHAQLVAFLESRGAV